MSVEAAFAQRRFLAFVTWCEGKRAEMPPLVAAYLDVMLPAAETIREATFGPEEKENP